MKFSRYLFGVYLVISLLGSSLVAQQQPTSASIGATVPRLVNFTGKTADAQGKAITGIAGVTFAIYKEQYEGAPLWLETQNVQADSKGNYTVQLGATKPDGLPLDLFSSGVARWLGVTVNGGQEQPRVLLLSVPYALKAADAETIGGLPPSAFVLAVPSSVAVATSANANVAASSASSPPPASSNVTTTGGTVNALPLWTTATNIQSSVIAQTGTGATAKVGINTTKPASTLDVNGGGTVRGNFGLPATGAATATAGKNSQPETFTASAYNSGTGSAVNQNLRWQAEPVGNNTSNTAGTLNLLYAAGSNTPAETGLKLGSNGQIIFAPGQTFPGTVSSVGLSAPGSDFTVSGSPVTNSGTLGLNWNVAPTNANTANAIVKRDGTGSFSAGSISTVTLTAFNPAGLAIVGTTGAPSGAIEGVNTGTSAGSDGVDGVTSSAFAAGVAGINNGGGYGVYGAGGVGVFGTGSTYGFQTDSNVNQARAAGGWVKAMVYVNAYQAPYTIIRCFNSTLAGAAAATPPCGFNLSVDTFGDWIVDFGFQVNDRFVSATTFGKGLTVINECTSEVTVYSLCTALTLSQILVFTQDTGGNWNNSYFHLIIY
jgi:hypothetical protein